MTDNWPDAPPLDATLASLTGWWLGMECECRRTAYYPFKLMATRYGAETRLREVLPKIKCEKCGARPALSLVENAAGGGQAFEVSAPRVMALGPPGS